MESRQSTLSIAHDRARAFGKVDKVPTDVELVKVVEVLEEEEETTWREFALQVECFKLRHGL